MYYIIMCIQLHDVKCKQAQYTLQGITKQLVSSKGISARYITQTLPRRFLEKSQKGESPMGPDRRYRQINKDWPINQISW